MAGMERILAQAIKKDLKHKIVLLSGPRQSGKTTLSKMITTSYDYLNYDYAEHQHLLREKSWDRAKELIIFDELHKMRNWKSWIKGIYDVEGNAPSLLITGSARLETIKKTGDSLAGRFFHYRLHPFDLKEMKNFIDPEDAYNRLKTVGGFPEPFLENDPRFYQRWKRSHLDIMLRQDLVDLESVRDIKSIEILIELLRDRVGSTVTFANLASDLQRDPKTVKHWLSILENMYIIFSVTPYSKKISRSLHKAPKYYFYDTAQVSGDNGPKIENIVACALLKELHSLEDTKGIDGKLYYLRNKDGKEIDFAVAVNGRINVMIEVKKSDDTLSRHFSTFEKYFPDAKKIQLVEQLPREKTYPGGAEIRQIVKWLPDIDLDYEVEQKDFIS
ncbi:MAG: ATP-binding protein [Spirochaetales bacterium]|nr:ATP-binding protein [Spirochaetales bacterium]